MHESAERNEVVLREEGCSSKCPSCGETCVGGGHPSGNHACGNGHSWSKK